MAVFAVVLEKVQITPVKYGQSPNNPRNYVLIQFTPTVMSIGLIYPLIIFVFFLFLHIFTSMD